MLLEAYTLGNIALKNRVVMAAMTRARANTDGVVGDLTVEYYTQRAGAGLILTEAINISADALGSPFTPGLFTAEQTQAWRKVTDAVHAKGGKIFAQLWHTGRIGHSVDRKGILPVAPSAVGITGQQHFTSQGPLDFEVPRALTLEEIKLTILDYKQAALHAIEAGFDGVELHAANGYLPNQFLADNTNLRTDEYGGSIENKSRFILEVMETLIEAIGGERVGIKLSPFQSYGGIVLNDPIASFTYLIEQLNKMDFAFIELMKRSPMFPLNPDYPTGDEVEIFAPLTTHTVIANCGYDKDSAEAVLQKGLAQLVSFGALFIANPDLPKRFSVGSELNAVDFNTMFAGGEKGYIDYPALA